MGCTIVYYVDIILYLKGTSGVKCVKFTQNLNCNTPVQNSCAKMAKQLNFTSSSKYMRSMHMPANVYVTKSHHFVPVIPN